MKWKELAPSLVLLLTFNIPWSYSYLSNNFDDLDDFRDLIRIYGRFKKCNWFTIPSEVYEMFLSPPKIIKLAIAKAVKLDSPMNDPVLIQAPCFSKQSLGNHFSDYIEARLCADISGMHYIATTVSEEHVSEIVDDPFLQELAKVVLHRVPQSISNATLILQQQCLCNKYCHSSNISLINRYPYKAARIFKHLIRSYAISAGIDIHSGVLFQPTLRRPSNGTHPSSRISKYKIAKVKFTPDVAIHMRCSDSRAGFLPFQSYLDMIPGDARIIYILTEDPNRFNIPIIQIERCIAVIYSLFGFIVENFPTSEVALFQAKDPYDDMLHMAYARVTICSVSSFCFWPALANRRNIPYQTRLLNSNNTSTSAATTSTASQNQLDRGSYNRAGIFVRNHGVYFPESSEYFLSVAKHITVITEPKRIVIDPHDTNQNLVVTLLKDLRKLSKAYDNTPTLPAVSARKMQHLRNGWWKQIIKEFPKNVTALLSSK